MPFRDELPTSCPPPDATAIQSPLDVFRVVKDETPSEEDFVSHFTLYPGKKWGKKDCEARGLSVFTEKRDCENLLLLPNKKNYKIFIVHLNNDSGTIKQTGVPSHHTWWPLAGFDILMNCEAATV